jgi:hypothetical protein
MSTESKAILAANYKFRKVRRKKMPGSRYYPKMWEQNANEFIQILAQDRLQDTNAATEPRHRGVILLL